MGVDSVLQSEPLEIYLNMTVHAIPCSGRILSFVCAIYKGMKIGGFVNFTSDLQVLMYLGFSQRVFTKFEIN